MPTSLPESSVAPHPQSRQRSHLAVVLGIIFTLLIVVCTVLVTLLVTRTTHNSTSGNPQIASDQTHPDNSSTNDAHIEQTSINAIRDYDFRNATWFLPELGTGSDWKYGKTDRSEWKEYLFADGDYIPNQNDLDRMVQLDQCDSSHIPTTAGKPIFTLDLKDEFGNHGKLYDPVYGDINGDGFTDAIIPYTAANDCLYRSGTVEWYAWIWQPENGTPREVLQNVASSPYGNCSEQTTSIEIVNSTIVTHGMNREPNYDCDGEPPMKITRVFTYDESIDSFVEH
ncbi:hypothetical protein I6E29_06720 [Arcanobacterium haemolyticum]|nr:hypothetical protein [Arcanobacterium haemolyticum]